MGIESYGLSVGSLPRGPRNSIADVADVKVGHTTVDDPDRGLHTGVTVVVPCEGPVFSARPVAAAHSLNGYGKTCGTVQVAELGYLETPIALTGTMNVGRVADALIENALREEERAGHALPQSVNPVVGETNDGRISRIQARPVGTKEVLAAIDSASKDFARGAVGAGRGTVCFGLKGASAPPPASSRRAGVPGPWACLCRQTSAACPTSWSAAAIWGLRSSSSSRGKPTPEPPRRARSWSLSPPTPRSRRGSSGA